ncbi:MAG: SIMPL domain-containing protein [Saprospiraceae bacterium]
MKTALKMLVLLCVSTTMIPAFAQTPAPRTVAVYGGAERSVEPDEIFLSLTLQEYTGDAGKVTISQLEGDLLKATKELGIPNNSILTENISGFNNFGGYEGAAEFMISKTYQVRATSIDGINKLLTKIGNQGLTTANITYFNNSKSKEILNELKVKALENAKMEAETLLKATGKKLGELISIDVITDYNMPYYDTYSPHFGTLPAGTSGKVSTKPMTLRFSAKVTYAIQ